MRLTTIARMNLAAGTVHRYSVQVRPAPGNEVPVSFDQERHVALGSRPGSWIAAAFRPTIPASRDEFTRAWHAVIARHGTLTTVFSPALDAPAHDGGRPTLTSVEVHPGAWIAPQAAPGEDPRTVLRREFDRECDPFSAPSYALCLVEPEDGAAGARRSGGSRPTVVIGFDHAHVDAWSLLVVARDFAACLADVVCGSPSPGAELPPAPAFARHTAELASLEATRGGAQDAPIVLLMHGLGSDERDLASLVPFLPPVFEYVSARGIFRYVQGYAWFDMPVAPDRPEAIESSAAALSLLLAIGTSALRAMTSRGVHSARARRAAGSAAGRPER